MTKPHSLPAGGQDILLSAGLFSKKVVKNTNTGKKYSMTIAGDEVILVPLQGESIRIRKTQLASDSWEALQ